MQLTIKRHPEEKPVGDVHHYGSEQIERVHVPRRVGHLVQAVEVFGCGAQADSYCLLETGSCQSWGTCRARHCDSCWTWNNIGVSCLQCDSKI